MTGLGQAMQRVRVLRSFLRRDEPRIGQETDVLEIRSSVLSAERDGLLFAVQRWRHAGFSRYCVEDLRRQA